MKVMYKILHTLAILLPVALLSGCSASSSVNQTDTVMSNQIVESGSKVDNVPATDRKLVRRIDMSLQVVVSTEIPVVLKDIAVNSESVGGYVSNQSLSSDWNVTGDITVNIPKDDADMFLSGIEEDSRIKVVDFNDDIEDITTRYVDIDSRLNSADAAKERYMEMLKEAQTVSDILEIQG